MTPGTTRTDGPAHAAQREHEGRGGHRLSIRRDRGSMIGRCSCGEGFQLRGPRGPRGSSRRNLRDRHRAHVEEALDYVIDLQVECVVCERGVGAACRGILEGRVHGARRIRRLLAGLPLARCRAGGWAS